MINKTKSYFSLLRPHQYTKNILILIPLFFGGKMNHLDLFLDALIAIGTFSLIASSVYVINDYRDIEDDKKHPKKKKRALASGAISKNEAKFLISILLICSLSGIALLSTMGLVLFLLYFVMNLAYSFGLKSFAVVDVCIISIGFVIRLFIGSVVTGIPLSMWIVIMTFLLALYLALAKRRDDVLIFLETGNKMRKVISGYNLEFLNAAMVMVAAVTLVSYILYTVSSEVIQKFSSNYLYLTAIFVVLGILRYMQVTFVENNSGSPTKLVLRDRFLQITILGWICSYTWILYFL